MLGQTKLVISLHDNMTSIFLFFEIGCWRASEYQKIDIENFEVWKFWTEYSNSSSKIGYFGAKILVVIFISKHNLISGALT